MRTLTFGDQLQVGKKGEQIALAILTAKHWDCELVPDGSFEQLRGIDITGTHTMTQITSSWQVKYDERAVDRVFVETIRNDRTKQPGWGYTCPANELLIILPAIQQMWTVSPRALTAILPQWEKQFQHVSAKNRTYRTIGIVVDFPIFKRLVYVTTQLKKPLL